MSRTPRSEPERFWPKVDKDGPIPEQRPELGCCWDWTASTDGNGYGTFRLATGRHQRAHKWAWQQEHGPVPEGLELDHLCRRPGCVRPSHLEAVTHAENCRRSQPGGRAWRSALTHCPKEHEYTPENTYVDGEGYRACRKCRSAASVASRQRSRARARTPQHHT